MTATWTRASDAPLARMVAAELGLPCTPLASGNVLIEIGATHRLVCEPNSRAPDSLVALIPPRARKPAKQSTKRKPSKAAK